MWPQNNRSQERATIKQSATQEPHKATQVCTYYMIHTVLEFISASPVEFEVHILISDTRYEGVSQEERALMTKCLVLPAPLPTGIDLERPCISPATGQYIYVVMVLFSATGSTMGINEFRVYSRECCSRNCDMVATLFPGLAFYLWLSTIAVNERTRYIWNILS